MDFEHRKDPRMILKLNVWPIFTVRQFSYFKLKSFLINNNNDNGNIHYIQTHSTEVQKESPKKNRMENAARWLSWIGEATWNSSIYWKGMCFYLSKNKYLHFIKILVWYKRRVQKAINIMLHACAHVVGLSLNLWYMQNDSNKNVTANEIDNGNAPSIESAIMKKKVKKLKMA